MKYVFVLVLALIITGFAGLATQGQQSSIPSENQEVITRELLEEDIIDALENGDRLPAVLRKMIDEEVKKLRKE